MILRMTEDAEPDIRPTDDAVCGDCENGGTEGVNSGITLMLGDCLERMKEIPDGSIDLTVTSPPYDNLRDYHGYRFDYEATLTALYRITKPGGVVVWVVNDQTINGSETGTSFRQALCAIDVGFKLHDTMIWHKTGTAFPDANRYLPTFEYMFVFSKGVPNVFNAICDRKNICAGRKLHGTRRQKDGTLIPRSNTHKEVVLDEYGRRYNIWTIPCEKHNKTGHPAVFPVKLVQDHILTWSNKGDMILDPFMGSGTTGIAAYRTNRNFIGIELDEHYFQIAKDRIERETAQMRMDI